MKVILGVLGAMLVTALVLVFIITPQGILDWVDNVVLQNETVVAVVNTVSGFFGWGDEPAVATAVATPGEVQSIGRVAENEIAETLAEGVRSFQTTISMQMATPYEEIDSDAMSSYMLAQVERAFATVRKEYPDIFWMSLGTYDIQWESNGEGDVTLHLQMNYCHSRDTARSMQAQIDQVVGEVLADAPADRYDALRYFHDWVINNTRYASAIVEYNNMEGYEYAFNIDGVFLKGDAVCEGYTKAFKLLCDEVGIPCEIVFGVADGENHGWNYVQLDGAWYLVDCTWDDPVSTNDILIWDYFLKGADSTVGGVRVADIYTNDTGVYPVLSANAYDDNAQSQDDEPPRAATVIQDMEMEASVHYLIEGVEGTAQGDQVAQITTTGGLGPYTYTLTGSRADDEAFRINESNGRVFAACDLTAGSYEIEVEVFGRDGASVTGMLLLEVHPADYAGGESSQHTHEGVA